MSGKEKQGVTRRHNRGRSTPDSKSKTDSGCFVDEELERNGSSDSSQGSINSSPVREKDLNKVKVTNKERKNNSATPAVPSSEPTTVNENVPNSTSDGKENVMSKDRGTFDKNESTNTDNEDTVCDVVEKTRRASDFYCLYYSESPEGTLTRSDVNKLKSKPPVPPKPKLRRGSAPPSSFNNIEIIQQQNKDITKRFSYNECQNDSTKPLGVVENFPESNKRKSVEDRVLLFEALAKDGSIESNNFLKNLQAKSDKNSSEFHEVDNTEVNVEIQNGLHCDGDGHNEMEKNALADSEKFSFESNSNFESFSFSRGVQEHIAPLVEGEEFNIDGSILFQSPANGGTVNGSYHGRRVERECLDCVNEIDEMEGADNLLADENQNGVNSFFHEADKICSNQVIPQETKSGVSTREVVNEIHNGFESFDVSATEDDNLGNQALPCKDRNQPSDCSYITMQCLENTHGIGFREHLVNPRLTQIKQETLVGSRQQEENGRQRRPGSIAGISNLERDLTSQMKRRSWSFSESQPLDINSPFVQKVSQVPAPKLITPSWQSENGLSSPFVCSLQHSRTVQSAPNGINVSQEPIGWSSHCRPGLSSFEQSGYTSDDSSVHSEPLFQPLRRQPQSLNNGHIFKSMSDDSSISAMDSGMPSFSKTQRKRFRHSLGSRDPVFALRRQSVEFADDSLSIQPVSHVLPPRLQTLRRSSSNASSSSDSEVERIFNNSGTSHTTKTSIHSGLVSAVTKRKVSAMEALFGPQSTRSATPSSDSEQLRPQTLSERFSEIPCQPSADDFLTEELEEEEKTIELGETVPKEVEEPRLEFDDTDYSEFYTRCEDKHSIISAEALSVKKFLQSPQTVRPDPDIDSMVMSVTERKVFSPSSDDQNTLRVKKLSCDDGIVDVDHCNYEPIRSRQLYRRNKGTQTPSSEVFRALSPPPSVGTQTPPLSVSQELLPPSLLKELQRDLQTPIPQKTKATASPTMSQEQQLLLLEDFRAISPCSAPFADADMISCLQDSDKAVSVEELLQILANMKVGSAKETPTRRPISVQRYNCSSNENVKGRANTNSLPSSWHHLNSTMGRRNGREDFQRPSGVLPRSAKSHDCLRQEISSNNTRRGVVQAKVESSESSENIRKKLKEWKLRSQHFEEEVECLEEKRKLMKAKESGRILKASYDGSESTENIETQSKLTGTHSLKRPRKDRAFPQREKHELEVNSYDEKQRFSLPTRTAEPCGKDDAKLRDSFSTSAAEESKFEVTSDSLPADKEPQINEVASPEGLDVFIDYRKKHGKHITSTPKPPPYPGDSLVYREGGVGKTNVNNSDSLHTEKPVTACATEDIPTDVESQGDASSSSYSSDDDRFGEFGGSTDTVVFVESEPSPGMSLQVPDLDTLDMKLAGGDKLLSIDNDDDEKDEASLDALLGEVRRSLNLEFVDSDILDKAIERFKQRVSPSSQNKALSGGLSMEAYVALHQADELQGIISEIKGELKLLHDENDMLREQVVCLANHKTSGEVSENSSTESSERLEHIYKLYKAKHVDTDEEDVAKVDVCLRGFSTVMLGHLPSKKKDIHLGTVTVKGADWNGVMEAARKAFVDHCKKIDPEGFLCLGAHSIQGVQTGVTVQSPDSLRRTYPRVELSKKSNTCVVQLKDGSHFSCDSLVYDTLLPKETIEKYVEELLEHRHIVLCGQQSLGKSYLAAKLAEHIVQRIGWKGSPAVVTFNVAQATRKELKQNLSSLMQSDISSPKDGIPAVIVLDQLNCLASLADIFDLSILEKDRNCPYIIGVRDKSRKGPFSSKELSLCHYFRWLRVSVNDRHYSGLLERFLRRKLSWAQIQTDIEGSDLLDLFEWLTKVWFHLNEILEEFCEPDSTIGPSLFFSCPMDYKAAEGWFVNVWNYNVIPYLHQALRSGRKIFDRCISWEDPTKWVVLRYPWNKDYSRVLHTLRKLRQVDVVLNRNQLGSDNVSFAECIEENEKILRAHSTVSKRVRTVVKQKIPKGELKAKRMTAEQKELLGYEEDKDSCYSDTDSYLETSI